MAVVSYKGNNWDVQSGIACIITPGIPTAVTTEIPKVRLEREITRLTNRLARATAARDEAQTGLDDLTTVKTGLDALLATVTADPA